MSNVRRFVPASGRLRFRLATLWLVALWLPAPVQAQGRNQELLRTNPRFLAAFRSAVADVNPGVVRIRCDDSDTALGIVVARDGWILTKAHDLGGAVTCRLRDGRELPAQVVGVHAGHDLALVHIAASGLTALTLADSTEARTGHWVASAGMSDQPIAVGVVSVPTRDLAGKVEVDPSQSPYLGVGLELAEQGVRINEILPATAAQRAGLRANDLILEVNGAAMRDPDAFIEELSRHKPGDTIVLRIARDGGQRELRATLDRRPSSPRVDMQNRMGSELSSRRAGYAVFLQHDTVLRPCDCGGPLVDLDGRVIGINICRAGRVETWAIPAEVARGLLPELKSGKLAPPRDGAGVEPTPSERADVLLAALGKRLLLMPEVARSKWNEGKAIQDPQREKALLERLVEQSRPYKLPAGLVRQFFTAQMAAARRVQENLFEEWKRTSAGEFEGVADLREVLRPAVERASVDLLAALARLQPHLGRAEVQERLRSRGADALAGEGITEAVRQLALEPLLEPNR